MILLNKQPKRGEKITYKREIMFKGIETVSVKIVAIFNRTLMLENGDSLYFLVNN